MAIVTKKHNGNMGNCVDFMEYYDRQWEKRRHYGEKGTDRWGFM